MTKENKIPFKVICIYCLLFYSIWTLYELFGSAAIDSIVTNEWLSPIVKSGIIKNVVWTLPAWLLVKRHKSSMYIKADEMFCNKVNWQKYILILAAFAVYLVVGDFIVNGSIAISTGFKTTKLISLLFVGITEEMVFRGWLLNASFTEKHRWRAILINSFMFLCIHFPRWLRNGMLISQLTSLSFVSLVILSIIFSWTFVKSKNLLVPITLHMFWDMLMVLLY